MALESASFITQLVQTNPTGDDTKSQGDDHLRLIKNVLKTTFPNLNAAVTSTPTQLNAIASPGVLCFPGMVVLWSGSIADIPLGWKLCNGSGTISTGGAVPDLRNRFVVGAGQTYAVNDTGGAATHGHTVNVADHVLTVAQIPSHTHVQRYRGAQSLVASGGANGSLDSGYGSYLTSLETQATGGGQGHNHSATATNTNHLPPYYALAYIIKD